MMPVVGLSLLLAAAAVQPAGAAVAMPNASTARDAANFRRALRDAEQGVLVAQLDVAESYLLGRDVPQDLASAARWFALAAAQGSELAQHNLGIMTLGGRGVARDDAAAARWFAQAARQGHDASQYVLATLYRDGRGVVRDPAEAARLFALTAAKGFVRAQDQLGRMYATGTGVAQDDREAYFWLDMAADRLPAATALSAGGTPPPGTRDHALALRDAAAARLSPPQLAEARAVSADWKAAWGRNRSRMVVLADRYLSGRGVHASKVEAFRWLSYARSGQFRWDASMPGDLTVAERDGVIERLAALRATMTPADIADAERLTAGGFSTR